MSYQGSWNDPNIPDASEELTKNMPNIPDAEYARDDWYDYFFSNPKRPTIVCLCGSTKFMQHFEQANINETLKGNIVLTVGVNMKDDNWNKGTDISTPEEIDEVKVKLDQLHKYKIDLAEEILVINVGGYIGESTKSEIEYAERLGKKVRYLE